MKEHRGHCGGKLYTGDNKQSNRLDEGQFHGQVEALVFPTFNVRRQ